MYCVVYRFSPKEGSEQRFVECWKEMTNLIKAELGGLGSRMHRTADGTYFAYAQWPSKAHWAKMQTQTESDRMVELSAEIKAITQPSEVIFSGDIIADLLNNSHR